MKSHPPHHTDQRMTETSYFRIVSGRWLSDQTTYGPLMNDLQGSIGAKVLKYL